VTFRRTIIIGDVHGCSRELNDLLDTVEFGRGKDRLILLGDLVDRGPDAPGVIKIARQTGAECVLGNHDEKLIRFHHHMLRRREDPNYVIPMRPPYGDNVAAYKGMTEEDWNYLRALPAYLRLSSKWVAVHAGLEPSIPIEQQKESVLTHMRYVRRATMRMEKKLEELSNEDSIFWTKVWDGPENIVYGHCVYKNFPVIDHSPGGGVCVGIDTGCCFGFRLTALVLEDLEGDDPAMDFCSVAAREQYDSYAGYEDAVKPGL
jgi:bis(5'-nucleosyl)-tetraphosphatase (symmetrical)